MKKISIRAVALMLVVFSVLSFGGCRKNPTSYSYYLSDDVVISGTAGATAGDKTDGNTSGGSTGGSGTTASGGSTGGSSSGKTTVKVAISSQRPTDVAPLFDALAE